MERNYYHLFANGDDAKDFIVCERDFIFEFNLIGICTHCTGATVVCFSIEDTHPHVLLYGTYNQCLDFKNMFEKTSMRHIVSTRGSADGVVLCCELYLVDNVDYLRNVGVYVIFQPTKDGKPVMYYDYRWGTGSMYFRDQYHISIWLFDKGILCRPVRFVDLKSKDRETLCQSHSIPDQWMISNGLILPDNYVDVKLFENIYRTHNCFRTFVGAGNRQASLINDRMSEVRGIMMEDSEARKICAETAIQMFGTRDIRRMDLRDRYVLAKVLRQNYRMTFRQLATLSRLPVSELEKYIR